MSWFGLGLNLRLGLVDGESFGVCLGYVLVVVFDLG